MRFNALDKAGSFSFPRSFRVGGELVSPGGRPNRDNSLIPLKIDEEDAARVLLTSNGELKVDGKGEPLPIERVSASDRSSSGPSVLEKSLQQLAELTKDISLLQENIDDGIYETEEQIEAVNGELSELRAAYDQITSSSRFQTLREAVRGLQRGGSAEEQAPFLSQNGESPLLGSGARLLLENGDLSQIAEIDRALERAAGGVSEATSFRALQQQESTFLQVAALDRGEDRDARFVGDFEQALTEFRELTRRLRFLSEGKEAGLFTEEQAKEVGQEEDALAERFDELRFSTGFRAVLGTFAQVETVRSQRGTEAAVNFARDQRAVLGDTVAELYDTYDFKAIEKLEKTVSKVTSLDLTTPLSSDDFQQLTREITGALRTLRGEEEDGGAGEKQGRRISLEESVFDRYQNVYRSTLADEVDDFIDITVAQSDGSYLLSKTKSETSERGSRLDFFA
ncbi:hypothetical protein MRY87_11310 [bacterium]|nr:hypothetical protein [bacterium]